jgi:hypothetical protein
MIAKPVDSARPVLGEALQFLLRDMLRFVGPEHGVGVVARRAEHEAASRGVEGVIGPAGVFVVRGSREPRVLQLGTLQLRAREVGPAEIGTREVGEPEVGVRKVRILEGRAAQVCLEENRLSESRIAKPRVRQ